MSSTSRNRLAAKPTTKKEVAKKTSTRKTENKAGKPTKSDMPSIKITPEERWKLIAVTAYHKAENRGFASGGEMQDWIEAEKEIDQLILG